MKPYILSILLILFTSTSLYAWTDLEVADAIYKAENSVKYPYGVKSIDTKGDKAYARKICLNTIKNNRKRFTKQDKYKDYLEFLASRYCPVSAHPLNKNWLSNVRFFLNQAQKG